MDTSKEYIEMCKKAKEIQNNWNPKDCNIAEMPETIKFEINKIKSISFKRIVAPIKDWNYLKDIDKIREYFVWLPRQDELQEIITPFKLPKNCESLGGSCHNLAYHFGQSILKKWGYYINFESMEQLWLAFVMWEKYKKIWDGKKWIKTKEK